MIDEVESLSGLNKEELLKIYEECKPTSALMKMKWRDYGPEGIQLLKDLAKLREDERSKEIPTK